ncbi:MAG: acetamidase/formamidase family protein [Rhodospirillaceae bacterium]|nr:acetamidase/formamidase family protein [Rhodospirillaceae bacterium]
MGQSHHISRQHRHTCWDNAIAPVLHIAPGDEVYFETLDASNGQVTPDSSAQDVRHLDFDNVNPVTGPVYVDGAEPGDALKITLLEFAPSGWGWSANIPDFGLLADDFAEPYMHHWHYPPELSEAVPYEGTHARVPFKSMRGAIGTALAEPGQHNILPPREAVGGTMDIRDMSLGTVLYLPVQVPGALLSMGDPHAAQGEGEVCGTGVESPIDVNARIELVKGAAPSAPRFTTPGSTTDHLSGAGYEVTTGIGPDLLENARTALRRMVELISGQQSLAPVDVYLLCSVCADMRLSQVVDDPNWIVSCYFPRIVFEPEN